MKKYLEILKDKFIVKTRVFSSILSPFFPHLLNANANCKQLTNLCCFEFLHYIIAMNNKEQLFLLKNLLEIIPVLLST